MKVVGLEKHSRTLTSELSYGSKRMLEIGIALSLKPKLLLLDEPLAGLSDLEIVEVLGHPAPDQKGSHPDHHRAQTFQNRRTWSTASAS